MRADQMLVIESESYRQRLKPRLKGGYPERDNTMK